MPFTFQIIMSRIFTMIKSENNSCRYYGSEHLRGNVDWHFLPWKSLYRRESQSHSWIYMGAWSVFKQFINVWIDRSGHSMGVCFYWLWEYDGIICLFDASRYWNIVIVHLLWIYRIRQLPRTRPLLVPILQINEWKEQYLRRHNLKLPVRMSRSRTPKYVVTFKNGLFIFVPRHHIISVRHDDKVYVD